MSPVSRSESFFDDRELIARMRKLEPSALREFFVRFQPMLAREASSLRVPPDLRHDLVTQSLDDVAVLLMRRTTPMPRALSGYVLAAFRHDVFNAHRDDERYERLRHSAALHDPGSHSSVVAESASEYSLRASKGPDDPRPQLTATLELLARALDTGLTDDERRLLVWIGHWVPQRVIAGWLGISYGAVRTRVARLRERLRLAAARYARQLSTDDQQALQRFFHRARPPLRRSAPQPNDSLPSRRAAEPRGAGE